MLQIFPPKYKKPHPQRNRKKKNEWNCKKESQYCQRKKQKKNQSEYKYYRKLQALGFLLCFLDFGGYRASLIAASKTVFTFCIFQQKQICTVT